MTNNLDDQPERNIVEWVGFVAVTWSYLEAVIQGSIWILAKLPTPDTGRAFTSHMSTPARLDVLMSLARLSDLSADQVTALETLCTKIRRDLSPRRNEVIHGLWGTLPIDQLEAKLHKISARGTVNYEIVTKSSTDLSNLVVDISDASLAMINIVPWDLAPPSWRGILPASDSSHNE